MEEAFLNAKLEERRQLHTFRQLRTAGSGEDFCSNDYLGMVRNRLLQSRGVYTQMPEHASHGSTGSRLLAGNSAFAEETEKEIARFHEAEAGLLFNSGYDANIGILSAIPQKTDTIIYDQLCHASIRDGIRLSFARSFSFLHNDPADLKKKIESATGRIFVVTESVFSMDGDLAPLPEILDLCGQYNAFLILDEAHATGIVGARGEGLAQMLGLHDRCFVRMHSFGKALGCHGAVVLGSNTLREYLINFCRSFIYTTALPESCIAAIRDSYRLFPDMNAEREKLKSLITKLQSSSMKFAVMPSQTAIQPIIIPGNEQVRAAAELLNKAGLDVRAILYPTVPKGSERLRVVLHSFNEDASVWRIISALS